ncbi:hypothetical protein FRC07_000812 [Ceratobasidium sp. 392]|nr:hypothetical protein FRC07_000812 [Ceratobasidium sp. 392]
MRTSMQVRKGWLEITIRRANSGDGRGATSGAFKLTLSYSESGLSSVVEAAAVGIVKDDSMTGKVKSFVVDSPSIKISTAIPGATPAKSTAIPKRLNLPNLLSGERIATETAVDEAMEWLDAEGAKAPFKALWARRDLVE